MSPIDQKTRPLKENHLIQRLLHRPVERHRFSSCGKARFPVDDNPVYQAMASPGWGLLTDCPSSVVFPALVESIPPKG
jgi:hypothetical protein